MSYIFQHKPAILKPEPWQPQEKTLLIVEPDEDLYGLYKLHLERYNFKVCHCPPSPDHVHVSLQRIEPHLAIVSGDLPGGGMTAAEIARFIAGVSGLPVITVSHNASPEEVRSFMEAGVRSHINRKFGRLKDIVEVVDTILNNQV